MQCNFKAHQLLGASGAEINEAWALSGIEFTLVRREWFQG